MEKTFKDALNDSIISEIREKLSKHRPDLLNDYDGIVLKMGKNKCDQNLINDMHKLLGAIIGDISVKYNISAINEIVYHTQADDCDAFTIHKEAITLFNYINKCVYEKLS